MKSINYPIIIRLVIFQLMLVLVACNSKGYSEESLKEAIQNFNKDSKKTQLIENAAVRYKVLAKQVKPFPDSDQALNKICEKGFPKKPAYLIAWHNKHANILLQMKDCLDCNVYRLRYLDVKDIKRIEEIQNLGRLLIIDAAIHEKNNDIDKALISLLNVFRFCEQLTWSGIVADCQLAENLHYSSSQFLLKIIPKLSKENLKKIVITAEKNTREFGALSKVEERMKLLSQIKVQEYLKPMKEDGFLERMSVSNASELREDIETIFNIQKKILALPSYEVSDRKKWKGLQESIQKRNLYFLGSFFEVRYKLPAAYWLHNGRQNMNLQNDFLQFKAMWFIEKFSEKKDLFDKIKKCHQEHFGNLREGLFMDPFSGSEYGFRKESSQTVIWSFGLDLTNQEGIEEWNGVRGDVVVKLANH